MIVRYYCSMCGKQFSSQEECVKHEEHCTYALIPGIRWIGSLEAWGEHGYRFLRYDEVMLQPCSSDPNNDLYDVQELAGTDSDSTVQLFKPTILSNLSVVDRSVRLQMFTKAGVNSKDVEPKMLELAKTYLTEVRSVIDVLIPVVLDKEYYEKGKKK